MHASTWQPEPRTMRPLREWDVKRWREHEFDNPARPVVIELALRNAAGKLLLIHMTAGEAEALARALADETRETDA